MQIYDVGTDIIVTVLNDSDRSAHNISTASPMIMLMTRPDGTIEEKTAVLNGTGTDGKLKYTTVDGDMNQVGRYQFQAYVQIGTNINYSTIFSVVVDRVLKRYVG